MLLEGLSDPDLRSDALEEVQDFVELPAPPQIVNWRMRLAALRARSDVRRSIENYGRIRRYGIAEGDF